MTKKPDKIDTPTPDKFDQPAPPAHLSNVMKGFWLHVCAHNELQITEIFLFQKACEAFDRTETARRVLEAEGLTFTDKHGQPRARPEVQAEVLNRAAFCKIIGEIHLMDTMTPWGKA